MKSSHEAQDVLFVFNELNSSLMSQKYETTLLTKEGKKKTDEFVIFLDEIPQS